MVTQHTAAVGPDLPGRRVTERDAWSAPGVRVLVAGIGMLLAGTALLVLGIALGRGAGPTALVVAGGLLLFPRGLAAHRLTSPLARGAPVVPPVGRDSGTIPPPRLPLVDPVAAR